MTLTHRACTWEATVFRNSILRLFTISAFAAAAAVFIAPQADAQDKTKLTINSFKSATLWPLWSAQKIGAFDKQGLTIDLTYTRDSKSQ
jgi:ABC-type nitrate/sulfonate/bicarbonate transport system substrate-binding protein